MPDEEFSVLVVEEINQQIVEQGPFKKRVFASHVIKKGSVLKVVMMHEEGGRTKHLDTIEYDFSNGELYDAIEKAMSSIRLRVQ